MTGEALALTEKLVKAFLFMPVLGLVAWWLISGLLEKSLKPIEAAVGAVLLLVAFVLGAAAISAGGWGFLGVLAFVYAVLLALACWEYLHIKQREERHLLGEVAKAEQALAKDPRNAAAYSFLGQALLKLGRAEEAVAALEKAVAIDPNSRPDRSLLRRAREAAGQTNPD